MCTYTTPLYARSTPLRGRSTFLDVIIGDDKRDSWHVPRRARVYPCRAPLAVSPLLAGMLGSVARRSQRRAQRRRGCCSLFAIVLHIIQIRGNLDQGWPQPTPTSSAPAQNRRRRRQRRRRRYCKRVLSSLLSLNTTGRNRTSYGE